MSLSLHHDFKRLECCFFGFLLFLSTTNSFAYVDYFQTISNIWLISHLQGSQGSPDFLYSTVWKSINIGNSSSEHLESFSFLSVFVCQSDWRDSCQKFRMQAFRCKKKKNGTCWTLSGSFQNRVGLLANSSSITRFKNKRVKNVLWDLLSILSLYFPIALTALNQNQNLLESR